MHSISGIIYLILAACLLPYVFTFIAKRAAGFKSSDNQNPREVLARSTGLASRAHAVQQNSFENLPLFIAAMLLADYLVVKDIFVILLGGAYILLRIFYGICYLLDWRSLRSVIWGLSMCCPILLLILCMKPIY